MHPSGAGNVWRWLWLGTRLPRLVPSLMSWADRIPKGSPVDEPPDEPPDPGRRGGSQPTPLPPPSSAQKSVLDPENPRMDSEGASGCPWSTARATAPSPGRPTPGVVKQDKSSGGSVDTTKTRSGPRRVRMSSGERPIGAAKGKQSETKALCRPPPSTPSHTCRADVVRPWHLAEPLGPATLPGGVAWGMLPARQTERRRPRGCGCAAGQRWPTAPAAWTHSQNAPGQRLVELRNRPQPPLQPPPTACLTASGAAPRPLSFYCIPALPPFHHCHGEALRGTGLVIVVQVLQDSAAWDEGAADYDSEASEAPSAEEGVFEGSMVSALEAEELQRLWDRAMGTGTRRPSASQGTVDSTAFSRAQPRDSEVYVWGKRRCQRVWVASQAPVPGSRTAPRKGRGPPPPPPPRPTRPPPRVRGKT